MPSTPPTSSTSWTPWAPRTDDDAHGRPPGPSAPPVATGPTSRPTDAGAARPDAPWGAGPPGAWAPGPFPTRPVNPVGWTSPDRAPVADDRRAPGTGSTPPESWPAPKLAGPPPGSEEPPTRRSPALVGFVAFLVGAFVVGGAFAAYAFGDRRDRTGTEASAGSTTEPGRTGPAPALDIHKILDTAQPSVVSIQTGGADSIFGGAGSGVVISEDGLIVTNAHVIEGAGGKIEVRFNDGTTASARLIGASTDDDIALIQAASSGLTPATLGSSANLRVGDDVVAIGNALNLGGDPSVTSGIVSAKDRSINDGSVSLDNLIQTDAAINPGNSGGPLFNAAGEVVGINTAIIDGAQNVGFSLAIDPVEELIEELKAGGGDVDPDMAVLGVAAVSVTSPDLPQETKDEYGVVATSGALLTQVDGDSAASDAGLEEGDVVVEVEGTAIGTADALTADIQGRTKGDEVTITVERQGRRRSFEVTLGPS